MKIMLLGSGGYFPNATRHTVCVWIPDCGLVLDAGTGIYRLNHQPRRAEYNLFLSHAHLDHVVGLTTLLPLLLATQPPPRFRVHAQPDAIAAVRDHLLAEPLFPVALPLEFVELQNPVRLTTGEVIQSFPLRHPGGSTGFRVTFADGKSLAYVTDTTADSDADYVDHLVGVDLLIHECYFADDRLDLALRTGHSVPSGVIQVAIQSGCRRLVLVHFDPLGDTQRRIQLDAFRRAGLQVELGTDELELEL